MSRNYHGKLMAQLFADLGVETAKLTHEMRIFAAQLMYEMGVSLEVRQTDAHCVGFFVVHMHSSMLHAWQAVSGTQLPCVRACEDGSLQECSMLQCCQGCKWCLHVCGL
jgi:hypothetical protein